jgi:CBS domain-containing protein
MEEENCGSIPIERDDKMVGMLTDRDIAVRVVAQGKDVEETKVSEVMTEGIHYCFEDDDIQDVVQKMVENHNRRIPVINQQKRLVGIVSLRDIARRGMDEKLMQKALADIYET